MAYTIRRFDRVLCVRWESVPELAELEVLLKDVVAARQAVGQQLIYIAIVPSSVDVPSGVQRHGLAKFGERATPYVQTTHLVLEGSGFKHAVQRSVVTALYLTKGGPTKVHVHKTVASAIARIVSDTEVPRMQLTVALAGHAGG